MSHLGIEDTVWWAFKRCPLNKSQWFIVAYHPPRKDEIFWCFQHTLIYFISKRKGMMFDSVSKFLSRPILKSVPPEGIALPSSTISSITLREDSASTMVVHLLTYLLAFQLHFRKLTWIPKKGLAWNVAIFDIYVKFLAASTFPCFTIQAIQVILLIWTYGTTYHVEMRRERLTLGTERNNDPGSGMQSSKFFFFSESPISVWIQCYQIYRYQFLRDLEKANGDPFWCLIHFTQASFTQGPLVTNNALCTQEKPFKITIHVHCFIPPKWTI